MGYYVPRGSSAPSSQRIGFVLNEMGFGVTEDSEYQVAAARVQDP